MVLGVSGGTLVRMPISGIGDTLAGGVGDGTAESAITKALAAVKAAIESAKEAFDSAFAQARLVQDTINLSSTQALGTSDILGVVAGGNLPTRNQFAEFFNEIERGNLSKAAGAAGSPAIAGIEELRVAIANLTNALAGTKQILAAAIGENATAIQNEQIARVTTENALSTQLGNLAATFGGNFSSVNTVSAAFATANESVATQFSTLNATIGGTYTSVNTVAAAIDSIDGTLAGKYGVTIDVNGYVSGFELISGGTSPSAFNIRADRFTMVMPGFAAKPVLVISNINGTPTLAFDGTIIADGTVLTGGIKNNAVTNSAGASGSGDSGPVTINVRQNARIAVTGFYAGGDAFVIGPTGFIVLNVNGTDYNFNIPIASTGGFSVVTFGLSPIAEFTASSAGPWTASCRITGITSTKECAIRIQEFAR